MKLTVNKFDYSPAELSSLILDGEYHSGLLVDIPQSWQEQSRSVLIFENVPMVLTSFAASWALGVGNKPHPLTASTVKPHRLREAHNGEITIEERTLAAHHYWIEGKCGVTTPLRTISDLLRCPDQNWSHSKNLITRLVSNYQLHIEDIEIFIRGRGKIPHKQLALTRAKDIDYPSETRYTS